MKIEAEIKNLKKILVDDEKFYQIPDYQRPYSWDRDNLSDLITDLVDAYLENDKDNYFCGSLVLVENESDRRLDVIDGQQRLTTFTIMACVIRDFYVDALSARTVEYVNSAIQDRFEDNKRKLKFLTNEKYQIDFEETVLKGIDPNQMKKKQKPNSGNRYLRNAGTLYHLLNERLVENDIQVDCFVSWLFEYVVMTVITCPSQDGAIQIFNVLNNRGMPLSSIDILKSSLMQKLETKEDRTAFKAKWETIITKIKFNSFELESILNTFLYYKLSTNPKSRLDKELLAVFERENKSALEIIKEIDNFTDAYTSVLTEKEKHLYCLSYLKHRVYWVSILSTASYTGYADMERLKKLLVAFYYQNWIAGATVARIKQTSFNIIKLIKSKQPIEKVESEIRECLRKYSTTKTYREELRGSHVYGRKWDKALLLLIEYFLTDDSKQSFIEINEKLHLEHVLPQSPDDSWDGVFTESERERWTNSLANLTLLSMRKNIQAQNFSFEKKIDAYQNRDNVTSSFLVTQNVISCNRWDVAELQLREEFLLNKISEVLELFEDNDLALVA